jgi:hypothetical protein
MTRKVKGNPMTYQKPLGILTSGNTLWNTWRQTYPDVQAFEPDLHGVDLHQAQLRGIDFHAADLTEADLRQADLRGADLSGADLSKALLDQTQFDEAKAFTEDRPLHLKAKAPEPERVTTVPAVAA